MKAWKVLAVMLTSLAALGCVSKEKPQEPVAAARLAQADPAAEQQAIVAHLLDAHREAVGQMRVATTLPPQPKVECN